MKNTGLEEAQAGIKIAGRNINNLKYAGDTTLIAESEELKSLLRKVKVKLLSCVQLFATLWTVAFQAGSPVHGIFQARVLEWVAISFSRGSSRPRDRTWVSHIVGRRFTV